MEKNGSIFLLCSDGLQLSGVGPADRESLAVSQTKIRARIGLACDRYARNLTAQLACRSMLERRVLAAR